MNTEIDQAKLTQDIAESLSTLRWVQRDEIQSELANRVRIEDRMPVTKEYDKLAGLVKGFSGLEVPAVELFGGADFAVNTANNGENPFENLKKYDEELENVKIQNLYRGANGWGYEPIAPELQEAAIEKAGELGMDVFRIFDMQNDIPNMETGINAVAKWNEENPERPMKVEASISYYNEPSIMSVEDYGNKFEELLKNDNVDSIVLKDYAGLLVPEVAAEIYSEFADRMEKLGIDKELSLHYQSQEFDVHQAVFEVAQERDTKVNFDTAIGVNAGSFSHPNLKQVLKDQLVAKGHDEAVFETAAFQENPMIQQLNEIERVQEKQMANYEDMRMPEEKRPTREEKQAMGVAGGAFAATRKHVEAMYNSYENMMTKAGKPPMDVDELYQRTLEKVRDVTKEFGFANTVTPGSKLAAETAADKVVFEYIEKEVPLSQVNPGQIPGKVGAKDVAMGRFGENIAMEKGLADTNKRDVYLLEDTLKMMDQLVKEGAVTREATDEALKRAGLRDLLDLGKSNYKSAIYAPSKEATLDDPNVRISGEMILTKFAKKGGVEALKGALERAGDVVREQRPQFLMSDDVREQLNQRINTGKLPVSYDNLEKATAKALELMEAGMKMPTDKEGNIDLKQAALWIALAPPGAAENAMSFQKDGKRVGKIEPKPLGNGFTSDDYQKNEGPLSSNFPKQSETQAELGKKVEKTSFVERMNPTLNARVKPLDKGEYSNDDMRSRISRNGEENGLGNAR